MEPTLAPVTVQTPAPTPTTVALPKVSEIIKRSWKFYKENFKRLWILFLFGSISSFSFNFSSNSRGSGQVLNNFHIPMYAVVIGVVVIILLAIFLLISKIALLKSLSDIKKGQYVGIKDAYKKGMSLFWGYVFITIISVLAIGGGYVLLLIPGMILGGYLYLTVYEYIHEDKKKMDALLGSWSLIKGRWWQVAWKAFGISIVVALIGLLGLIVAVVIGLVGVYFNDIGTGPVGIVLIGIAVIAFLAFLFLIIQPLFIIALFEFYLSLKAVPLISLPTENIEKNRKRKIIACGVIGIIAIVALIILGSMFMPLQGTNDTSPLRNIPIDFDSSTTENISTTTTSTGKVLGNDPVIVDSLKFSITPPQGWYTKELDDIEQGVIMTDGSDGEAPRKIIQIQYFKEPTLTSDEITKTVIQEILGGSTDIDLKTLTLIKTYIGPYLTYRISGAISSDRTIQYNLVVANKGFYAITPVWYNDTSAEDKKIISETISTFRILK